MHPVRQLQLRLPAQRHPVQVLRRGRSWRAPRRRSARRRWTPGGCPDTRYTLQVYVEDCTGCGLCVEACPVAAPDDPSARPSTWRRASRWSTPSASNIEFFETLPVDERSRVDFGTVRGTQFLQPLFEFSGACAGCGETPYLKLLSQLFGDRL